VLITCTQHHFAVSRLQVERLPTPSEVHEITHLATAEESIKTVGLALQHPADPEKEPGQRASARIVTVLLEIQGIGSVSRLAAKLASIDGVVSVNAGDVNVLTD
jgi:hypothetical protein